MVYDALRAILRCMMPRVYDGSWEVYGGSWEVYDSNWEVYDGSNGV